MVKNFEIYKYDIKVLAIVTPLLKLSYNIP